MDKAPEKGGRHVQPIRGYEVLDRIGSGGMGTIYKARQLSMNRIVALKVLKKSTLKDPLPLDRLRREALLIARMDHPNIVKGIDMGETERYYFFAMEYVEGRSVKAYLDLHGVMDELKAASVVRDVTLALRYAHRQKLTHRDIKPANILLALDGRTKLTDLGLAKAETDLTITREGTTVGTPQYIAPEQAKNPRAADIRSDIYSLGATYYHMVTGRMPFEGENMAEVLTKVLFSRPPLPEAVRPGLSPATSRVISRMMAKDPRRRYQTPDELLDDLDVLIEALREGSRELAGFIGMPWKESQRGRRPWKRITAFGGGGLVVLAAVLLFFLTPGGGKGDGPAGKRLPGTLERLRRAYESGELPPGRLLLELEGESLGRENREARAALHARALEALKDLLEGLVLCPGPPADRALVEGGLEGAPFLFRSRCREAAARIAGAAPDRFPPEAAARLKEILDAAYERFLARVERERSELVRAANLGLEESLHLVEERTRDPDPAGLREAWDRLGRVEQEGPEPFLLRGAEERLLALGGGAAPDREAARRYADEATRKLFTRRFQDRIKGLRAHLVLAYRQAHREYLEEVKRRVEARIEAGGDAVRKGTLDALLAAAAREAGDRSVRLPPGLDLVLPGVETLRGDVMPLFEQQRSRLKAEAVDQWQNGLFEALDQALFEGDFPRALVVVKARAQDPEGNGDLLDRWRKRIEAAARLEADALSALAGFSGLEVTLRTRGGGRYRGTVRTADPAAGTVTLTLPSGQDMTLQGEALEVEDLWSWARKAGTVDPWREAVYAYARGALEEALRRLAAAGGTMDTVWFLRRIRERLQARRRTAAEAKQALGERLDAAEQALAEGDWRRSETILHDLRDRFRSTTGWTDSRKRRDRILQRIEEVRKAEEQHARLQRLFSVPVLAMDEETVKVTYGFDSPRELADFDAVGVNWKVTDGVLVCGRGMAGKYLDFFHHAVGLRFGSYLDPAAPITVTFAYLPPVEGRCPAFLGVSIFGYCIAVRSFANGRHAGQVNGWRGDLEAYEDYFFFPDLGETRPRKGDPHVFGFQRGERYRIRLIWEPGRELRLNVDEKEVYRLPVFKADRKGIEIRTLRKAMIDDLTIEGKLLAP